MNEDPNNTIIELASINKLEDAVLRTEVIVPDVQKNDKTPSWDGEMQLYKTRGMFSKGNLLGRVPIQVKGTWVKRFHKGKAKFQAEVTDLRNYMNDGGVIFFLIQIKDYDDYKIYYVSLLPFDLRRLLDEAKSQKTKQITLEVFPHKYKDGIIQIFSDFLLNKKKQSTLLPNIRSMEDLEKSNMSIERFEFALPRYGMDSVDDVFDKILNSTPYIYVKPKDVEASFVVDRIRPEQIITHQNTPVEVKGEVLFDHIDIIRKAEGEKEFKIGPHITAIEQGEKLNFNYSFAGTLREQICDLKLLQAFVDGNVIKIGERFLKGNASSLTGHSKEEISDRLAALMRVDKTMEILHVKKDLEINKLSDVELKNLNFLVCGILDGTPVPLSIDGKMGCGKLAIGNVAVAIQAKKNPEGSGALISDFFTTDDMVVTEEGTPPEQGKKVSPYVVLTADSIELLDNVNLVDIAESIRKYPYSEVYGEKIVYLVLELLKYYDEKCDKDILDVVIQLIDFLQENDVEQRDLHEVNRIQTEKRRRALTKEEVQYLVSLKVEGVPLQYQLAANILLESFRETQLIYEQLDQNEREMFDTYPIKNLWIQ